MPAKTPLGRWLGRAAAVLGGGSAVMALCAADVPTGGEPGVRSFVLTNLYFATPGSAGACVAPSAGGVEAFYNSLPKDQQARFAPAAMRPQLEALMDRQLGFRRIAVRGHAVNVAKLPVGFSADTPATPKVALEIAALNGFPEGRGKWEFQNHVIAYNSCTNPDDFPALAKDFRTYDGKVAAGMNLDGKVKRSDFTGVDGAAGVDNQLWRAIGCIKIFRAEGDAQQAEATLVSALAPTLIELRGVDDPRNDPDVVVNIYAALDPVARDGRGGAMLQVSYRTSMDAKLRATTHGRIVDGVLTTDPVDLRLNYKQEIIDAPREIRGARIQATLKPDGRIEGGIFGYYTVVSFWDSVSQMTQVGANVNGLSCPGLRRAIDRLADGYRDPQTGRYTAISTAMNFVGVRAFAVRPAQVASAGGGNDR